MEMIKLLRNNENTNPSWSKPEFFSRGTFFSPTRIRYVIKQESLAVVVKENQLERCASLKKTKTFSINFTLERLSVDVLDILKVDVVCAEQETFLFKIKGR